MPSKLKLHNNQTEHVHATIMRSFRKSYFNVSYCRHMPGTLARWLPSIGDACQSAKAVGSDYFFGHACRNNKCNLVKTCIIGMMPGKRRRGRPRMQYIDNIKKWTRTSLEENVRLTEDRTAWRERSCAAGAANVRTDDAD